MMLQVIVLLLLRVSSEEFLIHLEIVINVLFTFTFFFLIFVPSLHIVIFRMVLLFLNFGLILKSLHELLFKFVIIFSSRSYCHYLLLKHIFGDVLNFSLSLKVKGFLELNILWVHHVIFVVVVDVLLMLILALLI